MGGDSALVERHRPLLEVMADPQRITHVGAPGTGYMTKLLVNLLVLAGRARQVTGSLTAQAGQRGLTESQRTGVGACVRYLTSNKEYLRYDEALASGWPIATGVVEGACRHLPVN